MTNKTPNHDLNLYEQGDENWTHTPDMETIEERLIVRDLEENRDNYVPYEDALFFARDSKIWYLGNGIEWNSIGTVGEDTNATGVTGIASTRDHIGPFHHGKFGSNPRSDEWGIIVWAEPEFTFHSAVFDVDLSGTNAETVDLVFHRVDSYIDETGIETTELDRFQTDPLESGPQRIDLGFTTESDKAKEYALTVDFYEDANGDTVGLRRAPAGSGGPSWDGWDDYTLDGVDLRQGCRIGQGTSNDWSETYFYYFDIEVANASTQVTSPWSHDVDEIYMRPRDPTEEFDVSPRSLWIDTS